MSHLDEGTLHALLDGELEQNEVREIQAHLGSCSACGTRLQSVKEVLAESDRLVTTLQFPGTPRRPATLDAAPEPARTIIPATASEPEPDLMAEGAADPDSMPPPAAGARRPPRGFEPQPVYDEAPPVLLVPEDSNWGDRRRRVILGMRWAALVLVAVGAGYIASEMRRTGAPAIVASPATEEFTSDSAPSAVVSEEEAPAAESPRETPPPRSQAAEPVAKAAPPPPERRAEAAPAPEPARQQVRLAADDTGADEPANEPGADEQPSAGAEEEVAADVREEAAEALAELDRQRRRDRAAAATAAIDSRARNAVSAPAPTAAQPAPAPAPRTLEQRSGIYLRIGLDEAARQLGRPVHVLEGMQQQFMGLAQGSASPGADPARPVVRVVYQDNVGRMILLDQQRIRPGQTWGTGETRWVTGEIGIALLGEPGPEILRNLRPRVR